MGKTTNLMVMAGMAVGTLVPAAGHAAVQPATPRPAITWNACPTEAAPTKQCAQLEVPRRYDRPDGPAVRVALARIPATGPSDERIGSLLWDAGGPGGVSTEAADVIVSRLSSKVRARFDFVAFDPRGIGGSRPLLRDCESPWPSRPTFDPFPTWGGVQDRSAAQLARANRTCLDANRRIAEVMGTSNVVRDLDRIRQAVGDEKLTFWATSYGTRIGYVYALRYPERVRAMVMDGSINPSKGYADLAAVGGLAQDSALRFLRGEYRPLYRTVVRTAGALTAEPVDLGNGQRFTRWDWMDLVGDVVPFQEGWAALPDYAAAVDLAREADGDRARAFLVRVKARPNSNEGAGFSVVNCLDYADRLSARRQVEVIRRNAEQAPLAGGSLTTSFAVGCAGLGSLRPDPIPLVTTAAQRARLARVPVLLANATHDGSTTFAWARQMQRVFNRPMIRYRSGQHVIWGATDSRCVNRPVDRFVLHGRQPASSRTCPFVPSTAAAATALP